MNELGINEGFDL